MIFNKYLYLCLQIVTNMTNSDFWASIYSVINDGFNPEGLAKLEEYAENFISGRLVYQ